MAASGRLTHIGRTISLVRKLLLGEVLDASRAAKLLGVQRAAADRQLKALRALPGVVVEPGSRPRRFTFDRFSLGDAPSFATAIAACFGSSLAPLFAGTTYESAMGAVREHVHRLTSKKAKFRHIDRKFVFLSGGGEMALPDRGGELDDTLDALLNQNWVALCYRHFDGTLTNPRVQPLTLVVYYHQLYLVARDAAGAVHPYRFARIEGIDAQERSFEYPSRNEYNPQQLFANSFGVFLGHSAVQHVVVKLEPQWATYATTHRWHHSQRTVVRADHVLVELDVRICPELEAWVLSFGEEAEVLQPPELKMKIAHRVEKANARYDLAASND